MTMLCLEPLTEIKFKSLHILHHTITPRMRLNADNVRGKGNIVSSGQELTVIFLPTKLVKGHCTPLPTGTLLVKSEPDWAKGKKNTVMTKIVYWSALTLTSDLESKFKVTAHPSQFCISQKMTSKCCFLS